MWIDILLRRLARTPLDVFIAPELTNGRKGPVNPGLAVSLFRPMLNKSQDHRRDKRVEKLRGRNKPKKSPHLLWKPRGLIFSVSNLHTFIIIFVLILGSDLVKNRHPSMVSCKSFRSQRKLLTLFILASVWIVLFVRNKIYIVQTNFQRNWLFSLNPLAGYALPLFIFSLIF